jgi:hypothetical protein
VFGDSGGRQESICRGERSAHPGASFGVAPPALTIGLPLVHLTVRPNALSNKGRRTFVECRLALISDGPKVDDPLGAGAPRNVLAVDPGNENVGVWAAVRVGCGQKRQGLSLGKLERPVLGVAHEAEAEVFL